MGAVGEYVGGGLDSFINTVDIVVTDFYYLKSLKQYHENSFCISIFRNF